MLSQQENTDNQPNQQEKGENSENSLLASDREFDSPKQTKNAKKVKKKPKRKPKKPKLKSKDNAKPTRNKDKLRKRRNDKKRAKPIKDKNKEAENPENQLEDDEVKPIVHEDADISLLFLSTKTPLAKEYLTQNYQKDPEFQETMKLFQEESSQGEKSQNYLSQFLQESGHKFALPKYAKIKKLNHPLVKKNNNQLENETRILENIFDQWDAEGDSDTD